MKKVKVQEKYLTPVSLKIRVADSRTTKVKGPLITEIKGTNKITKETRRSLQMTYIVEGVKGLFLSKKCSQGLGIITKNFPCIGDHSTGRNMIASRGRNKEDS